MEAAESKTEMISESSSKSSSVVKEEMHSSIQQSSTMMQQSSLQMTSKKNIQLSMGEDTKMLTGSLGVSSSPDAVIELLPGGIETQSLLPMSTGGGSLMSSTRELMSEMKEASSTATSVTLEKQEEVVPASVDSRKASLTSGTSTPARKPSLPVSVEQPVPQPVPQPVQPSVQQSTEHPATEQRVEAQIKQQNLNNTLKEIISDIDSNIKEQENIAVLKQQEQELRLKQEELAREIRQQQLLAKELATQNKIQQQQQQWQQQQLQQQQYEQQFKQAPPQQAPPQQAPPQQAPPKQAPLLQTPLQQQTQHYYQPPQKNISKYSTIEETHDGNSYTRKTESFQSEESSSSNATKRIDLHKIFTPATDAEEILPRNRKLYASSAFYSPTLHPTVEDQVELARRISHSLSDISNQTSKGQSMYVNRKKRSVKWVHEGCGQDSSTYDHDFKEDEEPKSTTKDASIDDTTVKSAPLEKLPLRLLMNPRGQMIDFNSVRESLNIETGLLSPDKCAELVTALQTQKGRGAELFAKRRKKAEKWVVDETNAGTESPSGIPDYQQYQPKPPTSPSVLPAYSDAGKHRVQLNMHQEQLLEKYAKPSLKVVKTPWDAALETGSASSAFVEEQKLSPYHTPTPVLSPTPTPKYQDLNRGPSPYPISSPTNLISTSVPDAGLGDYTPYKLPQHQYPTTKPGISNIQRDLAYKPSIPQGWNSPGVSLPKAQEIEQVHYRQQQHEHYEQIQRTERQTQICSMNMTKKHNEEHRHYILEAAKNCEIFNNKDEDEIIRFNMKEQRTQHDLNKHFIRSPELCVSPIPPENLLLYDNTMQELKNTCKQKEMQKDMSECDADTEQHKTVNVQKQLREFEAYQQQIANQQRQEEALVRQRKERLHKRQHQQQLKDIAQQQDKEYDFSSSVSVETAANRDQVESENEYMQVPISMLISAFEQQNMLAEEEAKAAARIEKSIANEKEVLQPNTSAPAHRNGHSETLNYKAQENLQLFSNQCDEELYIPKDIPLESYAPPPNVTLKQPSSYQPTEPYGSSYGTSPVPNRFPLAKPTSAGGFSRSAYAPISGTPTPTSTPIPPKQQYWAPDSYQKVSQQTGQNAVPVSFNPSPLSYDKLAKFDNPNPDQQYQANKSYYGAPRQHLHIQNNPPVRNTSPTPYASGVAATSARYSPAPYATTPSPYGSSANYATPIVKPTPRSPLQQRSSRFRATDLLHGQNFNNAARGWGSGGGPNKYGPQTGGIGIGGVDTYHIQNQPIVSTGNLPYTDF